MTFLLRTPQKVFVSAVVHLPVFRGKDAKIGFWWLSRQWERKFGPSLYLHCLVNCPEDGKIEAFVQNLNYPLLANFHMFGSFVVGL